MARKVDDLGRIVLPSELRRLHGIQAGDELSISVDGDAIILRKVAVGCVFCDTTDDLGLFKGKPVCQPCARIMADGATAVPGGMPAPEELTAGGEPLRPPA